MSLKSTAVAAIAALALATPGLADGIAVHDPYARTASAGATSGAAYFVLHNHSETDDRLVAAKSPVAKKVALHTHREDADGVMRMVHVAEGFALPANSELVFERDGNHVMFMGLTEPFRHGATVPLTLIFAEHGHVTIDVPVDLIRKPGDDGQEQGQQEHEQEQEHKHGD